MSPRSFAAKIAEIAGKYFARRLKTLKGLTPYEFICKAWGPPSPTALP
jgi:hypothetical protein